MSPRYRDCLKPFPHSSIISTNQYFGGAFVDDLSADTLLQAEAEADAEKTEAGRLGPGNLQFASFYSGVSSSFASVIPVFAG